MISPFSLNLVSLIYVGTITVSPAEVEKLLATDASKSAGPDNVPGCLLIGCTESRRLP